MRISRRALAMLLSDVQHELHLSIRGAPSSPHALRLLETRTNKYRVWVCKGHKITRK